MNRAAGGPSRTINVSDHEPAGVIATEPGRRKGRTSPHGGSRLRTLVAACADRETTGASRRRPLRGSGPSWPADTRKD